MLAEDVVWFCDIVIIFWFRKQVFDVVYVRVWIITTEKHDGQVSTNTKSVKHVMHSCTATFVVLKEVDVLFLLALTLLLTLIAVSKAAVCSVALEPNPER